MNSSRKTMNICSSDDEKKLNIFNMKIDDWEDFMVNECIVTCNYLDVYLKLSNKQYFEYFCFLGDLKAP